jgi:hypothetical protein
VSATLLAIGVLMLMVGVLVCCGSVWCIGNAGVGVVFGGGVAVVVVVVVVVDAGG